MGYCWVCTSSMELNVCVIPVCVTGSGNSIPFALDSITLSTELGNHTSWPFMLEGSFQQPDWPLCIDHCYNKCSAVMAFWFFVVEWMNIIFGPVILIYSKQGVGHCGLLRVMKTNWKPKMWQCVSTPPCNKVTIDAACWIVWLADTWWKIRQPWSGQIVPFLHLYDILKCPKFPEKVKSIFLCLFWFQARSYYWGRGGTCLLAFVFASNASSLLECASLLSLPHFLLLFFFFFLKIYISIFPSVSKLTRTHVKAVIMLFQPGIHIISEIFKAALDKVYFVTIILIYRGVHHCTKVCYFHLDISPIKNPCINILLWHLIIQKNSRVICIHVHFSGSCTVKYNLYFDFFKASRYLNSFQWFMYSQV